jgi:hypothetical protein
MSGNKSSILPGLDALRVFLYRRSPKSEGGRRRIAGTIR